MIEDFSSGYYRASLRMQRYEDGPVIERELYDFINRELYVASSAPVLMRVGLDAGVTFEVDAEAAVPSDVLALPQDLKSDESSVFLLKPEYARYMSDVQW